MQLLWEVTYRSGTKRVTKHFEDVLEFNQFVGEWVADRKPLNELSFAFKFKSDPTDHQPAFLPALLKELE